MATGASIVKSALRKIRVLASGGTPTTEEAADGFQLLQELMAYLSGQELAVFATRTAAVTLAAGTVSYAIPGARPHKILSADCVVSGISGNVDVVGPQGWAARSKGKQYPLVEVVYCDYAYPTPAVLVDPKPTAAGTLNLYCQVDLTALTADTDTFDLPPTYQHFIIHQLAIAAAGEYGMDVPASVAAIAKQTMDDMKAAQASDRAGRSVLETPPVN